MKVRNTYLTAIHNTYGTFIASKRQQKSQKLLLKDNFRNR